LDKAEELLTFSFLRMGGVRLSPVAIPGLRRYH